MLGLPTHGLRRDGVKDIEVERWGRLETLKAGRTPNLVPSLD
jgi:hypothetical protein